MGRSSFEQVSAFLRQRDANTPAPADLDDDVELLVRRCERVRNLGEAFSQVELSPYMQSMLRTRDQTVVTVEGERASAAVGS